MINFEIDARNELTITIDNPINPVDELSGYLWDEQYKYNPIGAVLNAVVDALYNSGIGDYTAISDIQCLGNDCAGYSLYCPFYEREHYITDRDMRELLETGETTIANTYNNNDYCWRIMTPQDEPITVGDSFTDIPTIYAIEYNHNGDNVELWFDSDDTRAQYIDDNSLNVINCKKIDYPDARADAMTKWDECVIEDTTNDFKIEIAYCSEN